MTEKRYVRILDYSEKEVRIFDENNQKNIFNIFFEGLDSAICLNGALEDTVDLLNYFYEEKKNLKEENEQLKSKMEKVYNSLVDENEQLKKELQIYHKLVSCSNCNYHDYDEFDNNDGSYDEFEVCRKGNDLTERICNEWRKL